MYELRIEAMLDNQNKLNNRTAGLEWTDGVTKDGRTIDWLRCIRGESNELRNSYPWEHWSKLDVSPDIDNAYVEVVDLWHFIMSYVISLKTEMSFKELAVIINKIYTDKRLSVEEDIVLLTECLDKATYTQSNKCDYIVYKFIKILDGLDMSFDALESLYYGKSTLNRFRQDNGYKENTYKKLWDGEEDNVYMVNIVKSNPTIDQDELYEKIATLYKSFHG